MTIPDGELKGWFEKFPAQIYPPASKGILNEDRSDYTFAPLLECGHLITGLASAPYGQFADALRFRAEDGNDRNAE